MISSRGVVCGALPSHEVDALKSACGLARYTNRRESRDSKLTCNARVEAWDSDAKSEHYEEGIMAGVVKKSFESPDESRTPDKTQVAVVDLGSVKAARLTMQPGWRWSDCIKPIVGTDSCQVHHEGMVVSGTMHVLHDDGTEADIGPGDRKSTRLNSSH